MSQIIFVHYILRLFREIIIMKQLKLLTFAAVLQVLVLPSINSVQAKEASLDNSTQQVPVDSTQQIPVEESKCEKSVFEEVDQTSVLSKEERLLAEAELSKKLKSCREKKYIPRDYYSTVKGCGASATHVGDLRYSEMGCSGYDPQRRMFASPIKVKRFCSGFNGHPEYVYHCVLNPDNNQWVYVGHDSVNRDGNYPSGASSWQFAVLSTAKRFRNYYGQSPLTYPLNGETRTARSIHSFIFEPTSCDFKPGFGSVLEYKIQLEQ